MFVIKKFLNVLSQHADFLSDNLENVRPSSSERNTSTPGNKIQRIKLHRGQVFVELKQCCQKRHSIIE